MKSHNQKKHEKEIEQAKGYLFYKNEAMSRNNKSYIDLNYTRNVFRHYIQMTGLNETYGETVRDMLGSKVRINIAQSKRIKTMLYIEAIESFQEKKPFTAKELLHGNLFGMLKNDNELKDSVAYAKKLAEEVF